MAVIRYLLRLVLAFVGGIVAFFLGLATIAIIGCLSLVALACGICFIMTALDLILWALSDDPRMKHEAIGWLVYTCSIFGFQVVLYFAFFDAWTAWRNRARRRDERSVRLDFVNP